jgi:hypothetical protein
VRRRALEEAGGIEAVRGEPIDDLFDCFLCRLQRALQGHARGLGDPVPARHRWPLGCVKAAQREYFEPISRRAFVHCHEIV